MSRRAPSNYDLVEDLIAHLALGSWLEAHVDDWVGPSSTGGDHGHTAPSESDPTGNAALADTPTSRLVDDSHTYLADLDNVKQAIQALNAKRHAIEPMREQHLAHAISLRATTGFCTACDKECDGSTPYLSLYNELCGGCRKAFERWPSSGDRDRDREAFITARRRDQKRYAGRR